MIKAINPAFLKFFDRKIIDSIVIGINLGLYSFKGYKTVEKETEYNIFINGYNEQDEEKIKERIILVENITGGITLARNLVNTPGNMMTPGLMADSKEQGLLRYTTYLKNRRKLL